MTEVDELEFLFSEIRKRRDEWLHHDQISQNFLNHVRSLARFMREPMDYPEVERAFPDQIEVAFAVCHPECGVQDFIVEGSTQECQSCGGLLFRITSRSYILKR